jgi:hypothetical protein
MNVKPTGIIFYGVCQIATENCSAKEGGVVTAVLTLLEANNQIKVCKSCLDYQIRNRIWNIEGAYVPNMKRMLDLAVVNNEGKVVIAVEVKTGRNISLKLAEQIAYQIISTQQITNIPYFFLVTPSFCYMWKITNGSFNELQTISVDSYVSEVSKKLKIPFDNLETTQNKTEKTTLTREKEHMLFERIVKNLFKEKSFIHTLPKEVADNFENSEILMEYVFS